MRRKDREITDKQEIIKIMEKCDVCTLALNNEGYPYILPLNYGLLVKDDKIELYFHGANEGTKLDLIRKDNRASFEMDCCHKLITEEDTGNCTMEFESVVGQGTIEILIEEAKFEALTLLMKHYHKEDFAFNKNVMKSTTVFKLTVTSLSGKSRKKGVN